MEIIKQELHPENEPNKVIYPKTSSDQVEGLNDELSPYQKKSDLDNDVSSLGYVKNNNLKTINGESVVGGGNVDIKMYMQEIVLYNNDFNSYVNIHILTSSRTPISTIDRLYTYVSEHNYLVPLMANSNILRPKGYERRVPIYIMYVVGNDIRVGYYDSFGITDFLSISVNTLAYGVNSCTVVEL